MPRKNQRPVSKKIRKTGTLPEAPPADPTPAGKTPNNRPQKALRLRRGGKQPPTSTIGIRQTSSLPEEVSTKCQDSTLPSSLAAAVAPPAVLPEPASVPPRMREKAIHDQEGQALGKTVSPLTAKLQGRRLAEAIVTRLPHVMVIARAGSGKTFTLVVGIVYTFRNRIPGLWTKLIAKLGFDPRPSSQQLAVWESMELSSKARTVKFCAFNKSVVAEFESKWGWVIQELRAAGITLEFSTMHSMGYAAVRRAFPGLKEPNSYRVQDIISELLETDIRQLRKDKPTLLAATEDLVNKCKMSLVGVGAESMTELQEAGDWGEKLEQLASYYDIDLNGCAEAIYALVPRVLDRCREVQRDMRIDFADMIWLPATLQLPVQSYDLLLGDEVQDWSRAQQDLAKRSGRRLVLCGDPKQAIYGFAGADSDSIPSMTKQLQATEQGCVELPLTVTRRCGKAIVAEANKYVADFYAHENNPAGCVGSAYYRSTDDDGHLRTQANGTPVETYHTQVRDGDFILCRCNAPLVSACFKFIRAGRKANIQGRDVARGLIATAEKLKAATIVELIQKLTDWQAKEAAKEQAKRFPSEAKIQALEDRVSCLLCFTEEAGTVEAVVRKIESIFTDDKNAPGIRLSSIHRAKGLEAQNVFILTPKEAPLGFSRHEMQPWELGQLQNLAYVAITRAISNLTFVS